MATLLPAPWLGFRWKRFFAALPVVFFSTEFVGASLTLVVLSAPEWKGMIPGGTSAVDFSGVASVGIIGIMLTSIPAAIYSLIMAVSFLRFPWTRKLPLAISYSLALTWLAFAAGWHFIMRDFLPGRAEDQFFWPLAAVSLVSAAVGAWVLHRYFMIVERHDRAA